MTATEITRTGYSKKISSDQLLINLCILRDACHELFCICGDFYASGTQDTEVTKPLCYTVFKEKRARGFGCNWFILIHVVYFVSYSNYD